MNVILLERLTNVGDLGDEVNVKAGFARNFLFPQGKQYVPPRRTEQSSKSVGLNSNAQPMSSWVKPRAVPKNCRNW